MGVLGGAGAGVVVSGVRAGAARGARSAVAAAVLLVAGVLGFAAPAAAQTDGREITRYDADITLGPDGVADVRLDFDFDFGDDPGHGPFLTLPTRQDIAGNDEQDRLFRITDVTASSETAPADLDTDHGRYGVVVRIGDEDVDDVEGTHTYTVTYRVEGWVNPAGTRVGTSGTAPPDGDELYLDVIGTDWEIPLSDVTATVTGPADIVDAACFAGPVGSTEPCTGAPTPASAGDLASARFGQDVVLPGEAFTVAAAWPAGTFPGVEPILAETIDHLDPWRPTSPLGAAALLTLVGGGAFAVVRARRGGRDREALGLAPGMVPDGGPSAAAASGGAAGGGVGRANAAFHEHRPPVAVRATPPDAVLPGELGTLLDEIADPRDVTATIVDLAVRGYLEIHEEPASGSGESGEDDDDGDGDGDDAAEDWRMVATNRSRADLTGFEQRLLTDLFKDRTSVRMSEVRETFASSMAAVQGLLYEHVTERGWFRANPTTVRSHWYLAGGLLLIPGLIVTGVGIASLVDGLALLGVVLVVLGIVVLALASHAPARTSSGTGVLAEAVAFKRYLETASPDSLRVLHGEDLFSRYLPYAIVFGLTERWAGVFGDLAARGERVPEPTWYHGYGTGYLYWGAAGGFGQSVESFSTVATESISAATPSSSGSSGTSGGFSGGGVGGGGGGGW